MEVDSDEDLLPMWERRGKRGSLTIHIRDDEIEDETEAVAEERPPAIMERPTPSVQCPTRGDSIPVEEFLSVLLPHTDSIGAPLMPCRLRLFRRISVGRSGDLFLGTVVPTAPEPSGTFSLMNLSGSASFSSSCRLDDPLQTVFAVRRTEMQQTDGALQEASAMLRRQMASLCKLRHRNMVHYVASLRIEKSMFTVMRHCAGGSIRDLQRIVGAFTEPLALMFAMQLLDGLHYLHRNETTHGAVCLENILIDVDRDVGALQVRIGNFAKDLQRDVHQGRLSRNLQSKRGVENDIWGLGCVAIEMLEGAALSAAFRPAPPGNEPPQRPPIPATASAPAKQFIGMCFDRGSCNTDDLLSSLWIVGGARGDAISSALHSPQYEQLEALVLAKKRKLTQETSDIAQQLSPSGSVSPSKGVPTLVVRQGIGFSARPPVAVPRSIRRVVIK